MLPFPILNQYGNIVIRPTILKVSAGGTHFMVLLSNGDLYASGQNLQGQLGTGNTTTVYGNYIKSSLSNVKNVFCGYASTIAITNDNKVYLCGRKTVLFPGDYTQLTTWLDCTEIFSAHPIDLNTIQISITNNSTMVLSDSNLYAIGESDGGSSGTNFSTYALTLRATSVRDLYRSGGTASRTYYINTSGQLYACGNNTYGQLGTGNTNSLSSFSRITNITRSIRYIICSSLSTIVICDDGTFYGMGSRTYGQLGDGYTSSTDSNRSTPAIISSTMPFIASSSNNIKSESTGFGNNFNFINSGTDLYAAGLNSTGILGTGSTDIEIGTFTKSILDNIDVNAYNFTNGNSFAFLWNEDEIYMSGSISFIIDGIGPNTQFRKVRLPF